jgi:hypothetical protein
MMPLEALILRRLAVAYKDPTLSHLYREWTTTSSTETETAHYPLSVVSPSSNIRYERR